MGFFSFLLTDMASEAVPGDVGEGFMAIRID
jgi:hypothetical protein